MLMKFSTRVNIFILTNSSPSPTLPLDSNYLIENSQKRLILRLSEKVNFNNIFVKRERERAMASEIIPIVGN